MSRLTLNTMEAANADKQIVLPAGHQIVYGGALLQVVRKEWFDSTNITADGWFDVTNASVVVTPKRADSLLLVMYDVSSNPTGNGQTYAGQALRLLRDGTVVGVTPNTHESYVGIPTYGPDHYQRVCKTEAVISGSKAATNFKLQVIRHASSQARVGGSNFKSSITVWEIAQ